MKKHLIFLLFVLLSCNSTSSKHKIPTEKMVLILKDMHIIQSYFYEQKLSNEERIKKSKQMYNSILSKYNVTKEDFYYSMNYYSDHVHQLDSIYKLVIETTSNPNEN